MFTEGTEPPEAGKKLFGDRVPEQAEGLSSNCRTGNGCPQMSKLDRPVLTGSHGSWASVTNMSGSKSQATTWAREQEAPADTGATQGNSIPSTAQPAAGGQLRAPRAVLDSQSCHAA